jgi:hypothetical protein
LSVPRRQRSHCGKDEQDTRESRDGSSEEAERQRMRCVSGGNAEERVHENPRAVVQGHPAQHLRARNPSVNGEQQRAAHAGAVDAAGDSERGTRKEVGHGRTIGCSM